MNVDNFFNNTVLLTAFLISCTGPHPGGGDADRTNEPETMQNDPHSYANGHEVAVTHLDLDIEVDFERKIIHGSATYDIQNKTGSDSIIFDTKGLRVTRVLSGREEEKLPFGLGESHGVFGAPLKIAITPETSVITIYYSTGPDAPALQWLTPQQTAGKTHPFLFTQSQAILARSWLPCQDSPGIRFTYEARVKVPQDLLALMSAENPVERSADGRYSFSMPQPIPSYLMALAAGDIVFKPVGERTGVYAEPALVGRAAAEFEDMEKMLLAAEELYGPYRWGRYDVIVLPPSFPFGGMENPRLTFATPTILAGDKSLTSLVAHELAHSWSGNLVTNATWNDFWLNEGFTVYFENRIMEKLYGRDYSEMLAKLGKQDLLKEVKELGDTSGDTRLKLDLAGRDPDDGLTSVAYQKGYLFLRLLEERAGRDKFDKFLAGYFEENAFRSMTSEDFAEVLKKEFLTAGDILTDTDIQSWIYGSGIPANCPEPESGRFSAVESQLGRWLAGTQAGNLKTASWSTHEWLHFIRHLPDTMNIKEMTGLDAAFGFTSSGNNEILGAWFLHVIKNRYAKGYDALKTFLVNVGRRKFLSPLYKEMTREEDMKKMALAIYAKARPNYHAVSYETIDEILGWSKERKLEKAL